MADGPRHIGSAVVFQVENEPALVKPVFHAGDGRVQAGRAAEAAAFCFEIDMDISPRYMVDAVVTDAVAPACIHRLATADAVSGQGKQQLQHTLCSTSSQPLFLIYVFHKCFHAPFLYYNYIINNLCNNFNHFHIVRRGATLYSRLGAYLRPGDPYRPEAYSSSSRFDIALQGRV